MYSSYIVPPHFAPAERFAVDFVGTRAFGMGGFASDHIASCFIG
jgi:hypothetical protein